MSDNNLKNAQKVYKDLCSMLDEKDFHYDKHEEDLVITFTMSGDDLPMKFILNIDAERSLVRLLSPIPVKFGEEKRLEGAIATSKVNFRLADGSFDYDYTDGTLLFRMTSSFMDSLISKELLEYMIAVASYTIDEYNDKFLMLAKGMLPLSDFLK